MVEPTRKVVPVALNDFDARALGRWTSATAVCLIPNGRPGGIAVGDIIVGLQQWSPDGGKCVYPCPGYWLRADFDKYDDPLVDEDCMHDRDTESFECLKCWRKNHGFRWRPAVTMPRRLSTIRKLITGVQPCRVQHVERPGPELGIVPHEKTPGDIAAFSGSPPPGFRHVGMGRWQVQETPQKAFAAYWNAAHGENAWEKNPEVLLITFQEATRA